MICINMAYGLNLQQNQRPRQLETAITNQVFRFNCQPWSTDRSSGYGLTPWSSNGQCIHVTSWRKTYTRWPVASIVQDEQDVDELLSTLNGLHPSLTFTMELPVITRSLLSAFKSSITELKLNLKFKEIQQTLDCPCTSKVIRINTIKILY